MLDKIKYKETSTKCAILFVGHTNLKGGIIMLKFQNNNTTIIATFEDFILTTYVISYYSLVFQVERPSCK